MTTCAHCSAPSARKYCSDKCKAAAKYLRIKADPVRYRAFIERIRAGQKRRAEGAEAPQPEARTCKCGTVYTPKHGRQLYCGAACRKPAHRKVIMACDACGSHCEKEARREQRYKSVFCSTLCRDFYRYGPLKRELPTDHWALWFGASEPWAPPHPKHESTPAFWVGSCDDCGGGIVERAYSTPSKWCSERCAKRVARRRRKAREHNAPGHFRYLDVLHQYRKQGMTCAYCHQPCDGLPDPEHVIPISRGGDNSMSNIVAACRQCNADKRDLTPKEWAADRQRRGLEPVDTSLAGHAFKHLALTEAHALAA